jgi:hypothetical protein
MLLAGTLGAVVIAACLLASLAAGMRDRREASMAGAAILPALYGGMAFSVLDHELHLYWLVPILGAIAFACVYGWRRICASMRAPWARRVAVTVPLGFALLSLPMRLGAYAWDHRYPAYAAIVRGSRFVVDHGLRIRNVIGPADDRLPTTTSPVTIWLGGRLFPESTSVARIDRSGRVAVVSAD